jgi:Flp pilus assembly protein TadG
MKCEVYLSVIKRHPSRFPRQSGQDLVEFAILIPILFLFIFGVIDLARVFHALNVTYNAAREGARYGSLYGLDHQVGTGTDIFLINKAEVRAVVRNEASNLGLNLQGLPDNNIDISCPNHSPDDQCASGNRFQVVVSYPFQFITTIVFNGSTITFSRSAEMIVP